MVSFKGRAKRIEDRDLPRIAKTIGVGEDEIHAVMEVEAAGSGFDKQGRVKALFEPHLFWKELGNTAKRKRAADDGLAYAKWKRSYPADSYPRILRAMAIDETAALRATSWGLGQILGSNHRAAGYATPQAMIEEFADDEDNHLEAMVRFIISKKLDDELRSHNWAGFARGYNGPSYRANRYDTKLSAAYAKWSRIKDTEGEEEETAEIEGSEEADPLIGGNGEDKVGAAPHGEQSTEIEVIQRRLKALGYNPGGIDGKWGGLTAGAIAAFKNDRHMSGGPVIDAALKLELDKSETEGFTRPIAKERATATAADIAPKAPVVQETIWSRAWAKVAAIGSTIGAGFTWLADQFDEIRNNAAVSAVLDAAGAVPKWMYALAAAGVAGVIWRSMRHAEQAVIDDVRDAKYTP